MSLHTRGRNSLMLAAVAALMLIPVSTSRGQATDSASAACAPARTALVLAGGGAKGFAHIGVLRVLDSLGVRPDLIVGSSVGAIMGALYASGYSGAQIDSLMRVLPISNLIHPFSPRTPGVLAPLTGLALWENDGRGFLLQTGAVQESEVTAVINALMLRGNLIARGDFDRLPIPLRVIATDLTTREAIVLGHGDLARAVRASAALPLVFSPIAIDGRLLFDGGVANNTPVRIAQALGATRSILSWLPPGDLDRSRLDDPVEIANAIGRLVFNTDTTSLGPSDVFIKNPTDGYSGLDLSPARRDELVAGGLRTARAALAGRCLNPLNAARPVVRDAVRPTHINTVTFSGERPMDRVALRAALGLRVGSHLSEDSLRVHLLSLGASDAIRTLWINPTGTDTSADFNVETVRSGRYVMTVGLAYDNDYGGRIWGGVADRQLLGLNMEGGASIDLNKYQTEVRATILRHVPVGNHAFPAYGGLIVRREDVRRFLGDVEFAPASTNELVVAAGVRPTLGTNWSLDFRAEYRAWSEPLHRNGPSSFGAHLTLERVSFASNARVMFDAIANTDFRRVAFAFAAPLMIGRLEAEPRARAGWGSALPLRQQFSFGGSDGFAGLINGSRRGSQEAMVSVALSHPLVGPVSLRADAMSGAIGSGTGFLRRSDDSLRPYDGRIVTGARFGIALRTPMFDITLTQGYNSERNSVSFVRIGRWF